MELWTNVLSLMILQIIAAQEDYYPEEYLSPPESCDASLPPVPYIPSSPLVYPPSELITHQYLPPEILPPQYISPSYPPSFPVQSEQDYETPPAEDEVLSLPSLPDISLDFPPPPSPLPEDCGESYLPPPSYAPLGSPFPYLPPPLGQDYFPALKKPKFGLLKKSGSLFQRRRNTLKEKCLATKMKTLNKIIGRLYRPSLRDTKCKPCQQQDEYENTAYDGYYPPPFFGLY